MTTKRKIIILTFVFFIVATLLTLKQQALVDGKNEYGFPFRFYTFSYCQEIECIEQNGFDPISLTLDILIIAAFSSILIFASNKFFKKTTNTNGPDSRTIKWMNDLNNLGFDKVAFPILIKDGADLNLVYLDEFASDPDLHYWEFESNYQLIDSNGQLWTWKYDHTNKTNLPGTFTRTMTLNEVKKIVATYFKDTKIKTEIEVLISEATTIFDLLEKLENKF